MTKVLGVDYGDVRTGLAVSDALGKLASSAGVIEGYNMDKVAEAVAAKAREAGAGVIVLGFPKNMNNTLGPRAEKTLLFKAALEVRFEGEVILRDERGTTVSATRMLNDTNTRGKKRKAVIDAVAATVILQDYLDSLR
ncbi:MAG TPA: Holliday junction resolvase RuvX [Candidatus Acidoferrum sp.]|nr:Holliday junction resolvase RuvX [Candidatus Acidoferrum sp.]